VETTVPRQSRKTSKAPREFGPIQFPELLGLSTWQFERALRDELIPPPDIDGRRWSSAVAGTTTNNSGDGQAWPGTSNRPRDPPPAPADTQPAVDAPTSDLPLHPGDGTNEHRAEARTR
jgi:hypothetical protein